MFNKYWRTYPWFLQLLQFVILIMVMASFFVLGITPLILKITGVKLDEIVSLSVESPRNVINAALLIQFVSTIGIFLIPALLFAYFTHPEPANYLGLRKPGKPIQWLLAVVVIISATPIFLAIAGWISHIDFGASVKQAQADNDRMMGAFLAISSPIQLFFAIIILAILPALSEELFFRGILMKFAAKKNKKILFALVLSSLVFALMHTNVYGLVSIFLAGMLLGGIYYLTGSIWCSVLAHMCYNGLQVLLTYVAGNSPAFKAIEQTNEVPVSWVLIGVEIFSLSFYFLWKNRTPLPNNWANDYSEEELAAENFDFNK